MTRFTDRVTRDLHQIADQSTPSSTAWESIRARIDEQPDQPTTEVIMLTADRAPDRKRGWMLAAAAVALLVGGGLVVAVSRAGDDAAPADTAGETLPTEPAPDITELEPTTTAAVTTLEPVPESVTVAVAGTFSTEDVAATTDPNSSGLAGMAAWQATTVYEGQLTGTAPGIWQTWDLGDGGELRVGEHTFTGTIDGLGSGTLTYADEWLTVGGITTGKAAITGATGDFEGASGSAVLSPVPAAPGDPTAGTYSWDITVPPKGSLVKVNATGTATATITVDGDMTANGISWTGGGAFMGSLGGPVTGSGHGFADPRGGTFGTSRWVFTGTIDGLGSGTMTIDRIGLDTGGSVWFDVVVEGTGDLDGITGTGRVAVDGSYTYTLTAPVNQ